MALAEQRTGRTYDYVLTLQPTTPFRLGTDVDKAIELLGEVSDPGASVTSVVRIYGAHPIRIQRVEDGRMQPYIAGAVQPPDGRSCRRRIFATERSTWRTVTPWSGSVWAAGLPYEMPPERSVNIDEPLDFLLAEAVIDAGLIDVDLSRSRGRGT